MAATEVQSSLSQSEHSALDGVLHPHLRLEPLTSAQGDDISESVSPRESQLDTSDGNGSALLRLMGQRSNSQPPKSKVFRQLSRPTVLQGTIEADNKRRPAVLKRNASKYEPPSPDPPDPNSEAKSATIRRMQSNLEDWEKQLQEICNKKAKNDVTQQSKLEKQHSEIKDLSERFSSESKIRKRTQKERDELSGQLQGTQSELSEHKQHLEQLSVELAQYEAAYQELDTRHNEMEEELQSSVEQLEKSEGMRRRLNDQVTELQGQLAIEEQRSHFCTVL